jgi:drug/metabolite transporter (DMT)-like permease
MARNSQSVEMMALPEGQDSFRSAAAMVRLLSEDGVQDPDEGCDPSKLEAGDANGNGCNVFAAKTARAADSASNGWIKSSDGVFLQGSLLVGYMVLDILQNLSVQQAARQKPSFTKQTLVVVVCVSSIFIGLGMTAAQQGVAGLKRLFDVRDLAAYGVAGVSFSISQTAKVIAIAYVGAGVNKVLAQTRVLMSALLAVVILGSRFTIQQWQCMIVIGWGVIIFSINIQKEDEARGDLKAEQDFNLGISWGCLGIFFSCFGSLMSEKRMKQVSLPFYMQKAQTEMMSLPFAVSMLYVLPWLTSRPQDRYWECGGNMEECGFLGGFFHHWNLGTWVAVVVVSLHAWCSGMLVKHLSTVAKNLANAVSFVAVFFVGSWLMTGKEPSLETVLLALLVLQCAMLYAQLPKPPKPAAATEVAAARAPPMLATMRTQI